MKWIIVLFFILIPSVFFSRQDEKIFKKEQTKINMKKERKKRPTYIAITTGLDIGGFTDFATSPLTYRASKGVLSIPKYFSLASIKSDLKREFETGLNFTTGNYMSNYGSTSTSYFGNVYYSRLYRLNKFSNQKYNLKAGGVAKLTVVYRENPILRNNSIGFDMISNLLVSAKITREFNRKKIKTRKFLFINYNLKPRIRKLAFRLDIGLINSNYRNGYAYSGLSASINQRNYTKEYTFNYFSGFRMSSSLDYTIFLNKNAVRFSYFWDAYSTGRGFNKFQMANHILKFTLLFNTNNK